MNKEIIICPKCKGTGLIGHYCRDGTDYEDCFNCKGTGRLIQTITTQPYNWRDYRCY